MKTELGHMTTLGLNPWTSLQLTPQPLPQAELDLGPNHRAGSGPFISGLCEIWDPLAPRSLHQDHHGATGRDI